MQPQDQELECRATSTQAELASGTATNSPKKQTGLLHLSPFSHKLVRYLQTQAMFAGF